MSMELHRLLLRQMKKHLGSTEVHPETEDFLSAISTAYHEFEEDLDLMERSIEISSREYNDRTAALQKAEDRLATLVETIPAGIMIIDSNGILTFVNTAAERIFAASRSELIGRHYNDEFWQVKRARGVLKAAQTLPIDLVLKTEEPIVGLEYSITDAKGLERSLYVNAAPLLHEGGAVASVVVSMEDITLRKQMENQLKFLSLHDPLTGLYNRAFFEEEMRRLCSTRRSQSGIIICDIDGLKLANDTLGHEHGDKMLLAAANILRKCFRQEDIIARIGGDEFAVLLYSVQRWELEQLCQRLKAAVEVFNATEGGPLPLTISVGFALSGSGADVNELFKEADNNMYREKLHHHQSFRSSIVQTLKKALEARDFHTDGHAERMREWMRELALAIGFTERKAADLVLFAQFHDIGKVGIPDRILFKPGPLDPEELQEMRRHSEIGHRIANSSPDLVLISDWILKHHEWWNGEGYPLGLKGREIPVECRILAVVDAYDAMTSDRPYRKALSEERAIEELERFSGKQFDPDLVDLFIGLLRSAKVPSGTT